MQMPRNFFGPFDAKIKTGTLVTTGMIKVRHSVEKEQKRMLDAQTGWQVYDK